MNEGRKDDAGKPMLDLLPAWAIMACGEVLTDGAAHYGPDNWRQVEGAKRRYIAAALRHLFKYIGGQDMDPESGRHHLAHAAVSILFVLELEVGK